jgi:hypothetical protein
MRLGNLRTIFGARLTSIIAIAVTPIVTSVVEISRRAAFPGLVPVAVVLLTVFARLPIAKLAIAGLSVAIGALLPVAVLAGLLPIARLAIA